MSRRLAAAAVCLALAGVCAWATVTGEIGAEWARFVIAYVALAAVTAAGVVLLGTSRPATSA